MIDQIRANLRLFVFACVSYALLFASLVLVLFIGKIAVYECECVVRSTHKSQIDARCTMDATASCTCGHFPPRSAVLASDCDLGVAVGDVRGALMSVSAFLGGAVYSWDRAIPPEHYIRFLLMLLLVAVAIFSTSAVLYLWYQQTDRRGDHPDVTYGPLEHTRPERIV